MIGTVRDWLPDSVLSRPALKTHLGNAIQAWSARWFVDRRLAVLSLRRPTGAYRTDDTTGDRRSVRDGLVVRCPPDTAMRLVGWALDADLDPLALSPADWSLIDGFEAAMLDDLADRLEALLKAPRRVPDSAEPGRDGLEIAIGEANGGEILSFAISASAALALCRSTLPERRATSDRPVSLLQALASTPVRVEAWMGRASVSVPELRRLAVGDVLVLDRRLDEPAVLSTAPGDDAFAHARLTSNTSPFILTLQTATPSRVA